MFRHATTSIAYNTLISWNVGLKNSQSSRLLATRSSTYSRSQQGSQTHRKFPKTRVDTKVQRKPDARGVTGPRIGSRHKGRTNAVQEEGAAEAEPPKRLLLPHVLSARLKKLCDGGDVDGAVSMLKNTPLDAQNTQVWNTLIWECMKAKRFRLSYELFIDMKRRGFSPSTRTFQTMFSGLSRIEHWPSHLKQLNHAHSLYEYFQRHINTVKKHDPDSPELVITPLASYIKILGDAGEHQRVFDVYYALDSEGPLSANQFIFTAMFQTLSERKHPTSRDDSASHIQNASDAKLLWRQMLRASAGSPGFPVDSYIISAAIVALSRGRLADQSFALEIVGDYLGLAQPGQPSLPGKIPLTVQSLAAALTLCNFMRNHKLCLHFFEQVKARPEISGGVSILDRGHMEEVLKAFVALAAPGSLDEPRRALHTLEWMLKQEITGPNGPKIRPAVTTYHLVLASCLRGVDWTCATRTFELMTGFDARDFEGGTGSAKPRGVEKRSKGRNLVPSEETMSYMVRTALASRNPAYMRQALRMVDHTGSSEFFDVGSSSDPQTNLRKTTTKGKAFHQGKLASALIETIDIILPGGKTKKEDVMSGEEGTSWVTMKARAKEFLRRVGTEKRTSAALESDDGNGDFIQYEKTLDSKHRKTPRIVTTI